MVVLFCVCAPVLAAAEDIRLFGTGEVQSNDIRIFEKWTGVLARDPQQRELMKRACGSGICMYDQWMTMIAHARGLNPLARLDYVNREINRSPYILDQQNWGVEDYWETPYEFFSKSGDCEDYAITKYMTLKEAGVPRDAMRIVVLRDNNLRLLHSVLAVRFQGRTYILDNQLQQVVTDSTIHHYSPIYSINETSWWRHIPE